jgi:SAM-dependent methyltransferase
MATVLVVSRPEDARPDPPRARWTELEGAAKASTYDDRWRALEAEGRSAHGEADLVLYLLTRDPGDGPSASVLDAGCGTGRVAIELARRGHVTIGVDRDADLLASARAKAPDLRWVEADLVALGDHVEPGSIDLAVLAGNVLIFLDPGTEAATVAALAATLRPEGLLVAGFQVRGGGYDTGQLDADAAVAGLSLRHRWSTWDREPWSAGGGYQVSVHSPAG